MEQGGYAASGVKHCVRPVDMSGKSQIGSYSILYACACKPWNQVGRLCLWPSPACISKGLVLMPSHVSHAFVCTHLCLESAIPGFSQTSMLHSQHGDTSAVCHVLL